MTEIVDLSERRRNIVRNEDNISTEPPPQPLHCRMKCDCGSVSWSVECYGHPDDATPTSLMFVCSVCREFADCEARTLWAQRALDMALPAKPNDTPDLSAMTGGVEIVLRRLLRAQDKILAIAALLDDRAMTWHRADAFETPEQHAWLYRQLHSAWEIICGKVRPVGKE